jgi:hypothetical protein
MNRTDFYIPFIILQWKMCLGAKKIRIKAEKMNVFAVLFILRVYEMMQFFTFYIGMNSLLAKIFSSCIISLS